MGCVSVEVAVAVGKHSAHILKRSTLALANQIVKEFCWHNFANLLSSTDLRNSSTGMFSVKSAFTKLCSFEVSSLITQVVRFEEEEESPDTQIEVLRSWSKPLMQRKQRLCLSFLISSAGTR